MANIVQSFAGHIRQPEYGTKSKLAIDEMEMQERIVNGTLTYSLQMFGRVLPRFLPIARKLEFS